MGEEDDVDVGGQRVGRRPGSLERGPPHERRPARQHRARRARRRRTARPSHRRRRRRRCCGRGGRSPGRSASRPRRTVLQPRSSRDTRPGWPGAPTSSHASSNHASHPSCAQLARPGRATGHDDLVDEAPRQRRRGVDAGPAERQRGGALAADAAGDARRAAGAGDQPEPELGEGDHGVGRRDHVVGERRDLDAGAHARAVQVHVQLVADEVGEPGRAAREPRDMGGGRIRERPELAEVAAAAERRPVAGQVDGGDRVVGGGERQRLRQRVAQRHRHRVVAARPVEDDAQLVAVTRSVSTGGSGSGGSDGTPRDARHARELGAGLQRRVDGRLGRQPVLHGPHGAARAAARRATPRPPGSRDACSTIAGSIGSSAASSTSYGVGSTAATSSADPVTTPTTTTGTEPGDHPGGGAPTVASTSSSGWPSSTVAVSPLTAANSSPRSPGWTVAVLEVTGGSPQAHRSFTAARLRP